MPSIFTVATARIIEIVSVGIKIIRNKTKSLRVDYIFTGQKNISACTCTVTVHSRDDSKRYEDYIHITYNKRKHHNYSAE